MPKAVVFYLSSAIFLGTLASCGIAPDGATRLQHQAPAATTYGLGSVIPAQLKLYTTPDAQPLPSCDVYAAMTLTNGDGGPLVHLRNERAGSCDVLLDPQDRSYQLKETRSECGSRTYVGTRQANNSEEPIAVKLIDHRARTCADGIVASIVVEEKYRDGETLQLFAKAPHAP